MPDENELLRTSHSPEQSNPVISQEFGSLACRGIDEETVRVENVLQEVAGHQAEVLDDVVGDKEVQHFIDTHTAFSMDELIQGLFNSDSIDNEDFKILKDRLSAFDASGRFVFPNTHRLRGSALIRVLPAGRSVPPEPIEVAIESGAIDRYLRTHQAFRFSMLVKEVFPGRRWLSSTEFQAIDERLQEYVSGGKLVTGHHDGRYISYMGDEEFDSDMIHEQASGEETVRSPMNTSDLDNMIKTARLGGQSRSSFRRRN